MPEYDSSQEFLDSLPEVGREEPFRFACHPDVPCFNACCGDLTLMLTPYDVLRLRRGLGMDSKAFITTHAEVRQAPDTGFPMLRLRMREGRGAPCPFVTPKGCGIYPDRPGACRTYPIGRASRVATGEDGAERIVEQFFLVKEPHCKGFAETRDWTPMTWLADQGLEPYNAANDRLLALMHRQRATGAAVDPRKATMVLLALYQLDSFKKFIHDMKVFDRLDLAEAEQERILADEESLLAFAVDWVELMLLGDSAALSLRKA